MRLRQLLSILGLSLAAVVALSPETAHATVASETSYIEYSGNGATVAFPTTFRFLANADLVVKLKPSGGSYAVQTLGVQYNVSGAGAGSGTVTMTTAPGIGSTLRIERSVPLTQTRALRTAGTFSPAVHEDAFDKLTMATQQLSRTDGDLSTSVTTEAQARAAADIALQNAIANIQVGAGGVAPVIATGTTTARTLSDRFAETGYNVKDFGVVCDGVTDAQPRLQATIDAAEAVGDQTVVIPPGTCLIKKPLRIRRSATKVKGAGLRATTIKIDKPSFIGPALVIGGTNPAFQTGASLATGSGVSLYFDDSDSHEKWLNVGADSHNYVSLNGATTASVELFYKPAGSIVQVRSLISAMSQQSTSATAHTTFWLAVLDDGRLHLELNIAGTLKILEGSAGDITTGNTYHLAVTYDNSTIRLFKNGTSVVTQAATGAIQQRLADQWIIGPHWKRFPNNTVDHDGPRGYVDSIRIRRGDSYHTSNFTAPTAKLAYDFATIFLVNFDNIVGAEFIIAQSGLTLGTPTYLYNRTTYPPVTGSTGGSEVSDIFWFLDGGGGIYAYESTNLYLHDMSFLFGDWSIWLENNCYNSKMERLTGVGGSPATFINDGASGVNTWRDIIASSNDYGMWIQNSGVHLENLFLYASNRIPLVLDGTGASAMTASIQYAAVSDEASGGASETSLLIDNVTDFLCSQCVLEQLTSAKPLAKIDGDMPVAFVGSNFNAFTGATEKLTFLSARTKPAVLVAPGGWNNGLALPIVPWSTTAAMVTVYDSGQQTAVKGISGTDTPSNNLAGTCTINHGSTSCSVTFATAEADTSYRIALGAGPGTGTPAAGALRASWATKTVNGFTINLEADPAGSATVVVNWQLLR